MSHNNISRLLPIITLSILIGLAIPSIIALASSVVGSNISVTNTTEQLRLGYDPSAYTSFTVDASSSLSIVPANSAGGWKIIGNTTSPNFVGGYSGNSIDNNLVQSAILSGGFNGGINEINLDASVIVGGGANIVRNNFFPGEGIGQGNIIGGGGGNIIQGSMPYGSVIVGGYENIIGDGDDMSTGGNISFIGGGQRNKTKGSSYATIAGGQSNTAWHYGFVGGGALNTAGTSTKNYSVAVGGNTNNASGYNAMILGGNNNIASGTVSFASGQRAKAIHNGAFVWADYSNSDFSSAVTNETAFRSTGGVRFVTAIDGSGNATRTAQIDTSGNLTLTGGVKLSTTASKPACALAYRGMFWVTQGAAGVKDSVEVCAKDASDTYAWRTIY